jgi:hypothetical protein
MAQLKRWKCKCTNYFLLSSAFDHGSMHAVGYLQPVPQRQRRTILQRDRLGSLIGEENTATREAEDCEGR